MRPEPARDLRVLLRERRDVGKNVREQIGPLERVRDAPEASAQEDERPDAFLPEPVGLERDLRSEGVPDEHDRRIAETAAHRIGVCRVSRHADALRVGRRARTAVAAIVEVRDRQAIARARPTGTSR